MGRDIGQRYVSLLNIVPQKVVPHLYVFRFGVEDRIFGYAYGTGAVTEKWNLGALLTKVTHGIGHPKQLGTATSSSYIFSLSGGLGYT